LILNIFTNGYDIKRGGKMERVFSINSTMAKSGTKRINEKIFFLKSIRKEIRYKIKIKKKASK
jgi:hypothetical protein